LVGESKEEGKQAKPGAVSTKCKVLVNKNQMEKSRTERRWTPTNIYIHTYTHTYIYKRKQNNSVV
jgi:hypothetical protein